MACPWDALRRSSWGWLIPADGGNAKQVVFRNTNKPVDSALDSGYHAYMISPVPSAGFSATRTSGVRIEAAYDCDGTLCHQPLFDEDGGLHYVAPHCHLVECAPDGRPRFHAVFCDFPAARLSR